MCSQNLIGIERNCKKMYSFSKLSIYAAAATFLLSLGLSPAFATAKELYTMPVEDGPHEATWLQWPHNYGWDSKHKERYQDIWLEMVKALHTGEKVRIIAYNWSEKKQITRLLKNNEVDMSQVEIFIYKTDDVWVRDNGPMFALNNEGEMVVQDWKFNGWGGKADWWFDDYIPKDVAWEMYMDEVVVPMVNEGGSIEVDGKGTLMAKRSSILNENRNPGMSQKQAEAYFRQYLGVSNFIWLDGEAGIDITDDHIDGTARFANGNTIVTLKRRDYTLKADYDVLAAATDADGNPYNLVHIPLTAEVVPEVGYHGLYTNYYVGNDVIIFPIYNDVNDNKAARIVKNLYPNKKLAKILITELYADGGAAHCVTMQQPAKA